MKSSDYLRAFKNRDLNREIDFAQAKWKEHDHHTFGDFAKWFENQSPPGCKLTIECMCDPELVKRLENIPLILIDPIWLAATGRPGLILSRCLSTTDSSSTKICTPKLECSDLRLSRHTRGRDSWSKRMRGLT